MNVALRTWLHPAEARSPREKQLIKYIIWIGFWGTLIDQITKSVAVRILSEIDTIPVIKGCFNLTLAYNYGAAFGQFKGYGIVLIGVSVAVFLGCIIFMRHWTEGYPERFLSLGFLFAGIWGNTIDRIFREPKAVVDFFDCYISTYHWPIFNVADIMICTAVGIFALSVILRKEKNIKNKSAVDVPSPEHE